MGDSKEKPAEGRHGSVPKAVVSRLSLYQRELQRLQRDGHETTSSTHLGKLLGVTDAQVRKDLAYFGQFGYPGVGYRCAELINEIKKIMGTDRRWPVALVGVGNLGQALLGYKGFGEQGFRIVAAFDQDREKVGQQIDSIQIRHMDDLPEVIQAEKIRLAILAVPAPASQHVADLLVAAGIEGVLNFAPVTLAIPPQIRVIGVDLAIELEQLSFAVVEAMDNS